VTYFSLTINKNHKWSRQNQCTNISLQWTSWLWTAPVDETVLNKTD